MSHRPSPRGRYFNNRLQLYRCYENLYMSWKGPCAMNGRRPVAMLNTAAWKTILRMVQKNATQQMKACTWISGKFWMYVQFPCQ